MTSHAAQRGQVLLSAPALCLSSHLTKPQLAIGSATGCISIATLTDWHTDQTARDLSSTNNSSCRVLTWLHTNILAVGYGDCSVYTYDVQHDKSARIVASLTAARDEGAHAASAMHAVTERVVVVGDDNGGMSVCDTRVKAAVVSVLEQGDYVSTIQGLEMYGTSCLLATSGDGTLCAYDLRVTVRPKIRLMYGFDSFQDDLTSLCVLRGAGLMVGGTLGGALQLYDARFMDRECEVESVQHVQRFVGHPESVTGIAAVDDDALVCTASTDGYVRIVDVTSRSLHDILDYAHEKDEGGANTLWPIENIAAVNGLDGKVFALQSHEKSIKLCKYTPESEGCEEQEQAEQGNKQQQGGKREQGEKRRETERPHGASKKRRFAADREREKEEAADRTRQFFDGL